LARQRNRHRSSFRCSRQTSMCPRLRLPESDLSKSVAMSVQGHSRPGRASSRSSHFRYAAESGSKISLRQSGHGCALMRPRPNAIANVARRGRSLCTPTLNNNGRGFTRILKVRDRAEFLGSFGPKGTHCPAALMLSVVGPRRAASAAQKTQHLTYQSVAI
jgi:hypothetical protein